MASFTVLLIYSAYPYTYFHIDSHSAHPNETVVVSSSLQTCFGVSWFSETTNLLVLSNNGKLMEDSEDTGMLKPLHSKYLSARWGVLHHAVQVGGTGLDPPPAESESYAISYVQKRRKDDDVWCLSFSLWRSIRYLPSTDGYWIDRFAKYQGVTGSMWATYGLAPYTDYKVITVPPLFGRRDLERVDSLSLRVFQAYHRRASGSRPLGNGEPAYGKRGMGPVYLVSIREYMRAWPLSERVTATENKGLFIQSEFDGILAATLEVAFEIVDLRGPYASGDALTDKGLLVGLALSCQSIMLLDSSNESLSRKLSERILGEACISNVAEELDITPLGRQTVSSLSFYHSECHDPLDKTLVALRRCYGFKGCMTALALIGLMARTTVVDADMAWSLPVVDYAYDSGWTSTDRPCPVLPLEGGVCDDDSLSAIPGSSLTTNRKLAALLNRLAGSPADSCLTLVRSYANSAWIVVSEGEYVINSDGGGIMQDLWAQTIHVSGLPFARASFRFFPHEEQNRYNTMGARVEFGIALRVITSGVADTVVLVRDEGVYTHSLWRGVLWHGARVGADIEARRLDRVALHQEALHQDGRDINEFFVARQLLMGGGLLPTLSHGLLCATIGVEGSTDLDVERVTTYAESISVRPHIRFRAQGAFERLANQGDARAAINNRHSQWHAQDIMASLTNGEVPSFFLGASYTREDDTDFFRVCTGRAQKPASSRPPCESKHTI